MPLTAGGKLTIVASSDLGALGPRDGPPVAYNWVLPGIAPLLLPWLAILGLLVLKPNRCAAAWLIWLPLGCVIAFTLALLPILPAGTDFFLDVIAALAVGLAAVWLLSDYLRRTTSVCYFSVRPARPGGFQRCWPLCRDKAGISTMETFEVGSFCWPWAFWPVRWR